MKSLILLLLCAISTLSYCKNSELFNHCKVKAPAAEQDLFIAKGKSKLEWLGGDNANSIKLDTTHYLWTFGDTLLGQINTQSGSREMTHFIHDSFALVDLRNSSIRFMQQTNEDKQPQSFFTAEIGYYWILSGAPFRDPTTTSRSSSVVLGLANIENTSESFRVRSADLAVIRNPSDPIKNWQVQIFSLDKILPPALSKIHWVSSMVIKSHYLYLFGGNQNKVDSPLFLARIKIADLLKKEQEMVSFEFYSQETTSSNHRGWRANVVDASELQPLTGLPMMSEFSLYYDKKLSRWLTLYLPPFDFKVFLYSAKHLVGPWKKEQKLYDIPAPWSTLKRDGHPVYISYAPKIHPEFNKDNSGKKGLNLTFSYLNNLNLFSFPTLWQEMAETLLQNAPSFYSPQLVTLNCN